MSLDDLGKWAGALFVPLGAAIGMVWKKVDNALPRAEFIEFLERQEKTEESFRENIRKLYENAEKDRKDTRELHHTHANKMHEMELRLLLEIRGIGRD